ncbi:MAG: hypoxanthine phosphoribosyltransferase [Paludibacteraceae bacterium]|nr:hypoxanthine phosphoribosyltransferase [Paludibacteraceae bacterium]MBO7315730.1 hypoxanthine phosphoribosyltransferase [Paludibacteraceae bacterium]
MEFIQVKDKTFKISVSSEEIQNAVGVVANQINDELKGENPIFLGVLNGCFMFMSDLMKQINIPCEVSFIKFSSYSGTETTGKVKQLIGLNENIEGRSVVIVEDIVDTGITMKNLIETLQEKKPKQIKVATFLQKPNALKCDVTLDYVAMKIPNEFIVGYGLDYDGFGRNLNEIYTIIKE